MIINFLFTTLLIYSVTQIVSESTFPLFRWLRNISDIYPGTLSNFVGSLFSCFLCTSVWVGSLMSIWYFDISEYAGYPGNMSWCASGLVYSCIVWFIHVFENR